MQRAYLEEDLTLIQKYFPGAKTVALRTPFDLTQRPTPMDRTLADSFQATEAGHDSWHRGALWTN